MTALAVHGVIEAASDPEMGEAIEKFDVVTPDGQPVRAVLNLCSIAQVWSMGSGSTLMLRLCESAAEAGVGVYLYGSTPDTVARLAERLQAGFPELRVAGAEPSIFRPLTATESVALAKRVACSGAGIFFVGLGCPRQEKFAVSHRQLLSIPQVCVGAAFDFHAGTKRQAPEWMQRSSLNGSSGSRRSLSASSRGMRQPTLASCGLRRTSSYARLTLEKGIQ